MLAATRSSARMHAHPVRGAGAAAGGREGEGPRPIEAEVTVLIVDDDPIVGQALREDLEQAQYQVRIAASGREGLAMLASEPIDLMLLDLMMPEMSGFDVLARMGKRDSIRYLPVIVLSSRDQDAVRALQAGAVDYVTKPWQPEELLVRVRTHVQLRRREAELADAVARLNQRTRDLENEIIERKRAEAQLIMASRMSSLGVVTAGIAHEINNPLTYLLGNLDIIGSKLRAAQTRGQGLELGALLNMADHAIEGAERVRLIVRDLRAFSRPDSEELEPVNLIAVLDSVLRLAGHEIKHRARIAREYAPVPAVVGNASRLSQVLLNVVANASQAMEGGSPERDTLRISTRVLADQNAVEVRLRDSGVGMDADTLSRAFELFYTTKRTSAGTGLGLPLCRKIVEGFGGRIDLASELGKGTEVIVQLPIFRSAGAAPGAADRGEAASVALHEGRVLVVDDEAEIGGLVASMLEGKFKVEVARDVPAGLALLRNSGPFDVILCDLMMPGLSGMDMYEMAAREHPELGARFVFMTGGPCTARAGAFVERHTEHVLDKPFTFGQLANALERARSF